MRRVFIGAAGLATVALAVIGLWLLPGTSGGERALKWHVPAVVDANGSAFQMIGPETTRFSIAVDLDACGDVDESVIRRIEVDESDDRVVVTVVREGDVVEDGTAVLGCQTTHFARVRLESPLAERALWVGGPEPKRAKIQNRS